MTTDTPAPPASDPTAAASSEAGGPPPPLKLGLTHWLIIVIASIGFAFDIYELLMLPLILRPAFEELAGIRPGTPEFTTWLGLMFYVPAFAGGIFGLLGGYITDMFGRRRVLTASILLYAVSAFAAGFATDLKTLLFLRCTTFVGVCVEFVAAVAWLAELFPNPHQREKVLGYTQAFSSFGGLLVAVANGLAIYYAASLPAIGLPPLLADSLGTQIADPHAPWRYTLMSGLLPAIPLILIRPFLPESPAWAAKRAAGTLRRPSFGELFSPALARTTIVTMLMFAASYGAAFGALQQLPQIVPGLPDVKAHVAQAKAEGAKVPQQKLVEQNYVRKVTEYQEVGGLAGRFTLAALATVIISRRMLLRVFQGPGLLVVPGVFFLTAQLVEGQFDALGGGLGFLYFGAFAAGFFTVAQFSFWGNYLPTVYPLHLRGTGESMAANIGGRLLGTSFAAVTAILAASSLVPGQSPAAKFAFAAAGVAAFVYLAGTLLCFWLPEPTGDIDAPETPSSASSGPMPPAKSP